jgi:uncharacterized membrane protein YeiH
MPRTIIGTTIAYNLFGLNSPLTMTLAGVVTAVGDRDIEGWIANEVPLVFVNEPCLQWSY